MDKDTTLELYNERITSSFEGGVLITQNKDETDEEFEQKLNKFFNLEEDI